jgi:uronate dehydrogenase
MLAKTVLLTGAAGKIGAVLCKPLSARAGRLISADIAPHQPQSPNEEYLKLDVRDFEAVCSAMQGVDIVYHFGGIPAESNWGAIRSVNIDGTFNIYEAARLAGTRRIVFASSNHFAGYYRRDRRIGPDVPLRPDSRYGVSKVAGEAIARLYADKYGIETIALRIGQFRPEPTNLRMLSLWLSHADMVRLALSCLEAEDIHFEIVYGISANTRAWYDNPGAKKIGFCPQDNAEDYAVGLSPEDLAENEIEAAFQGGPYCSDEFSGELSIID